MADIFISYSSEDREIVKTLAALLEDQGWTVWWDRQIPVGQHYDTVIENELKTASCALVVWTQKSIQSEWVKTEALEAAHYNKLVPVLLEKLEIPLTFKRIETAKLIDWKGDVDHPELQLLLQSIKSIIEGKAGADQVVKPITSKFRIPRRWLQYTLSAILFFMCSWLVYSYVQQSKGVHLTIRIFNWKKFPITEGDIKIYLPQYVRIQSIDKTGQAFFNDVPIKLLKNKMKIEINSPGYVHKTIDTLWDFRQALELRLDYLAEIIISGKVKTAAEIPISGVEVNVEGTKYFDRSKTDGSYSIRLEKYTLGDEVTISTSHKSYEDKAFQLKLSAPELYNQDIFLQAVSK